MASLAGFKEHFWQITYGGTGIWNILFFAHVDENVNYAAMHAAHKDWLIALTAFAGAGFGNGLTYALSLWGMASKKIQARNWLFYFFFWWNVNSLGNFIDYVPSRTFGTHGDMANLAMGAHVSPWWIMIILGYLVLWAVWYFYTKTLVRAYDVLSLKKASARAVLLIFVTLILFALYGMIGFDGYGPLSHFISQLSLWIMLPILVFCWPTRLWVKTALKTKFI